MAQKNILQIIRSLGPGLLFAGAAVGVSHLVQSTKAGATFGFGLLAAVLLANLFKYPFFEFGTRYAMSSNETLIDGYRRLGTWAIVLFLIVTIGTMFTIQAAVTVVTAALAINLFGVLGAWGWSVAILALCGGLLVLGRYSFLDKLMKFIIIALTLTTIFALGAVLFFGNTNYEPELAKVFTWDKVGIGFLIALMGWMPAPLDLAVWSSIWSLEKKKLQPDSNLKTALFDFNVGYMGTVFLAVCFLSLGALVMYGTGEELSSKAGVFGGQLIEMYTQALGAWAKPLIAIAALTTMFSTTLTCLDAFPRVLSRTTITLLPDYKEQHNNKLYWLWLLVTAVGALVILGVFQAQMGTMVNVATILSFLTAPILAFMNYKLVTGNYIKTEDQPAPLMRYLSWAGLFFLTSFSILYIAMQFMY